VLVLGDLANGSALTFSVQVEGASVAVLVVGRVIDGEYPNYRQLMPERGAGAELHFEPAALLEAIGNAAPYCRDTSPMRLVLDAAGVHVSASSPDLGTYAADVEGADWAGEDMSVAFNPTYLAGCVRALDGAPAPVIELRDGLKPAIVRSVADEAERVALVMPVRMPGPVGIPQPAKVEPEPAPVVEADEPDRAEYDREAVDAEFRRRHEPDPEPAEPEDAAREAEVEAEVEADEHDGAGHVVDLPPAPTFEPGPGNPYRVNGNGHGSTVDRSALVAKLREGTSTGSEEWCELADVGEAGGVRVRLVGGPDGRPRIDARRFVSSKRYNGPTKKGFAVEPDAAAVLAGLLLDAAAAAAELETV
jgi:hypothetical protein